MGFLDFLKSKISSTSIKSEYRDVFDEIMKEARSKYVDYALPSIPSLDSYKRIMSQPDKVGEFAVTTAQIVAEDFLQYTKMRVYAGDSVWRVGLKILSSILRTKTTITISQFKSIAVSFHKIADDGYFTDVPYNSLISRIEERIDLNGLTPEIKDLLKTLKPQRGNYTYAEKEKVIERINFLLQGSPELKFGMHDELGKAIEKSLQTSKATATWQQLFNMCIHADAKGEPSQKWLKEAEDIIDKIGHDEFVRYMFTWLETTKTLLVQIHKSEDNRINFLRNENHAILKGLIWCCGLINNADLNNALEEYAVWAYKKKPGHGPLSAKTGTACMCAFAMLPMKEGVPRLSKFKTKIKNNTVLKGINKFVRQAAKNNDVSEDEIEELSVPDFGILNGKLTVALGDYTAVYNIEEASLLFERDGKQQKAVPAAIKESHASELKKLKSATKEIESLLPIISTRLERSFIRNKSWTYTAWNDLYRNHGLTATLTNKLVWHFSKGDLKAQGFIQGVNLIDVRGNKIDWIDDKTEVRLWHPIGFSSQEILHWREFIRERKIVQPFKQAYREVYIITDAELNTETYSNRFAAHILRQHQFAALCRQRGWHYQLMGNWDSHNTPYVDLPEWNIRAMYYVASDWQEGNTNAMGIFNYISTDQVRFQKGNEVIPIHDVPAMVFTEIMRDVDLFVGVTSIGNDPGWMDGGNEFMNAYWRTYSFNDLTESAQIRSQVLQSLVPSLRIAGQCSFDKKFLIVEGKVRTYKIHMGSGNILMAPDDQYLCIVPDGSARQKDKVFLPFEGDNLLSIIISKALLLAEDDKIKDTTILSQIHRK